MKIIFVTPLTPRLFHSGLEELTLRLAKWFKLKGFDVEIFTTCANPQKNYFIGGIPIKEFKSISINSVYHLSFGLLLSLRKSGADIVHCNGYNNLLTIFSILGKPKNSKFVLFANKSGTKNTLRRLLTIFFDFFMNLLGYRIDKIVASSNSELQDLKKIFWFSSDSKFSVIRNGVDKKFIEKISVNKKNNYIISVGRLVEHKGFQYALNAFSIVSKKMPDLRFIIVGDGPERKNLENLAKNLGVRDKVDFLGVIPFSERKYLLKLIKGSKCFIFLSSFEGDPLIVSQAVQCKIPIILYDKGVLSEYVRRNNCVGVDNLFDSENIASKIISVIEKPIVPNSKNIPDWENTCKSFLLLYKSVLKN